MWYFTLVLYHRCDIIKNVKEVMMVRIDIKHYLDVKHLTIYQVSKRSGYGYTTLHKSFNKEQSNATPLNLRDLDAIARAQHRKMWEVLKELEEEYLER